MYSKRISFWLLNYGSTDETGRSYVNVDKSWSLLHKVYTNNPEEWKWTVNAHLRNKAKSGKLFEGIEDDKAVIIFICRAGLKRCSFFWRLHTPVGNLYSVLRKLEVRKTRIQHL